MDFNKINDTIQPLDLAAMNRARARWDSVAKPIGSLGLLEDAIIKIAGLTGSDNIKLDERTVAVFCSDNGIVNQGVAATPPHITRLLAELAFQGKTSVCVMAKRAGVRVVIVDMGMFASVATPGILDRRIGAGTRDFSRSTAMTRPEAEQAIQYGIDLARQLQEQGMQLVASGEIGIGNTTTASAIASVMLGLSADDVTGPGAGLTDEALAHKKRIIKEAITQRAPDPNDALDILSKVGGFDIAGMCGLFLGGAIYRVPVLVDGFISAAAALVAQRLCPTSGVAMLASHVSAEPAGRTLLDALGLRPLITADMRLGEGTGAVAAIPLLDMALDVYRDMITYADLGM